MGNYLISIQAAMDALEKEKPTPFVNEDGSIDPFGAGRQNQWYRDGIAIMNLPSAKQRDDIEEAVKYIKSTQEYLTDIGETWYADYLCDAIELLVGERRDG